jgi:Dolichyl-phosphate-mannose-protein mannosyltransferase
MRPAASRLQYGALAALLAVGTVIRVVQFLHRPSLSVDEAMLALNIGSRSYGGLLRRLDYGQTAPVLFLWTTRFVTRLGGVNEFTLRALPLAAGLAFPVVLWRVAGRLLGVPAALWCVALAACSPVLVRFSVIAKPYETDALVAAALIWCALETVAMPGSATRWWGLLVGGVAGLVLSAPAIFTLAGVAAALVVAPAVRGTSGARLWVTIAAVVWGAVFAGAYFGLYRPVATSEFMQQFWAATFLRLDAPDLAARLGRALREEIFPIVVGTPIPIISTVAFTVLAGAGLFSFRRLLEGWTLILAAVPVGAAFTASALQRYPMATRTLLFITPWLIVVLVAGLRRLVALLPRSLEAWAFRIVGGGWVATAAVIAVTKPDYAPDARRLVREFEQGRGANEPVYVFATGAPTWTFYTTDWAAPDTGRLRQLADASEASQPPLPAHREDLAIRYQGRCEILGDPTGMQIRYWTGLTASQPYGGWAEREAARLRAESRADAWLFLEAYFRDDVVRELLQAVERGGGRRVQASETWGARLYRYRLDRHGAERPCAR